MVEGQLVRHTVLLITRVRGCQEHMEVHMDHAWLMMRSHAQGGTWVHSVELGRLEVGGDDDNGGDDDARSSSSPGSKGSRGKGRANVPAVPSCPSGKLPAAAAGPVAVAIASCGS